MKIRPCSARDARSLTHLVRAFADHEELPRPTHAAARRLLRDLGRRLHGLIAEVDGEAIGYALHFFSYASFRGRPKLYLEDLFVLPEHRRGGLGRRFFAELRRIARREGCARLEWCMLERNEAARRFYAKLGARPSTGLCLYQLDLRR